MGEYEESWTQQLPLASIPGGIENDAVRALHVEVRHSHERGDPQEVVGSLLRAQNVFHAAHFTVA